MRTFAILAFVASGFQQERKSVASAHFLRQTSEPFSSTFSSAEDACQYCENESFSNKGATATPCECYSLPVDGGHNMFCGIIGDRHLMSTVTDKGGCICGTTTDATGITQPTCTVP